MNDPRLQAALDFAARGYPVFPLREGKLPAIKNWERSATTDAKQISAWFEATIDGCNFGFPPGRADIVVLDTDRGKTVGGVKVDGEDSLRDYAMDHTGTLPDTFTVRTPSGGLHRYYHAAELASKNGFLPAVDVKTNGGFVVIPGSRTRKGEYTIERALPVAELPEWFAAAYGRRKRNTKDASPLLYNTYITPDTPDKLKRAAEIIDAWPFAVEGERNDQLFQLMRELCKAGVSRDKATELYAETAQDKIGLDPEEAEVAATIRSAYGNLADLGSESTEGRHLAVRLFDDLPPLPEAGKHFTDDGGIDWLDLAHRQVPPRRWFIEHWLSADEGYTVLFSGRGGTGKSALMLDLMHSLATGEPFCGMPVLRGAKTLFLSCEDSEEEIARRIQKRSFDSTKIPRNTLKVWPRLGQNNVLCVPDRSGILQATPFMAELRERGKEFFGTDGGVLILDTLSDLFAGNENDRSQVSQFVKQHLNRLGRDLGVTIIVLAHPAKGISTTRQGFSGSTAWEGAFRCRWELNYQKAERVDGLLELVLAKSNSTKAGLKISLENSNGMFLVVDEVQVDDRVKGELVRLIAEAYNEGRPFGSSVQSTRPIIKVRVCDPITKEPLSEREIKELVSQLQAEALIESYKSGSTRGLRPVKQSQNEEEDE